MSNIGFGVVCSVSSCSISMSSKHASVEVILVIYVWYVDTRSHGLIILCCDILLYVEASTRFNYNYVLNCMYSLI